MVKDGTEDEDKDKDGDELIMIMIMFMGDLEIKSKWSWNKEWDEVFMMMKIEASVRISLNQGMCMSRYGDKGGYITFWLTISQESFDRRNRTRKDLNDASVPDDHMAADDGFSKRWEWHQI